MRKRPAAERKVVNFKPTEDVKKLIEVFLALGGNLTETINEALLAVLPSRIAMRLHVRRLSDARLIEQWNQVTPFDDELAGKENDLAQDSLIRGSLILGQIQKRPGLDKKAQAAISLLKAMTTDAVFGASISQTDLHMVHDKTGKIVDVQVVQKQTKRDEPKQQPPQSVESEKKLPPPLPLPIPDSDEAEP